MRNPAFSFGSRSLLAAGVMLTVAQTFQPGVLLILRNGMNAAWMASLIGGIFAALLLLPVGMALQRLPGGTLSDLAQKTVGRWGAIVVSSLLSGVLCFIGGVFVRETSEMAITGVFPHTPQTFATTTLLLGAVYVALGDDSSLVRLGRLLLPTLIISVAIILVGTLGWGEWKLLLPFWGPGLPVLLTTTPSTASFYAPAVVLATLAGGIRDRPALARALVLTPLISAVILSVVKMVLAMIFAFPIGTNIAMPMHMAARLVVGGRFFERLEGVWVFMWVLTTTVLLGAFLHAAAVNFARAFSLPRHTTAVYPLATAVLTIAFFPPDQATAITWHQDSSVLVTLVLLGVPAGLGLLGLFRLRGAQ